MDRLLHKTINKARRKNRIRSVVHGTATRPRLSVHISNRHVVAQLIDDTTGKTLAMVSSVAQTTAGQTLSAKAAWVGQQLADKAKPLKVKQVVFDRGGRLYHGRVQALAEAARKAGLEF